MAFKLIYIYMCIYMYIYTIYIYMYMYIYMYIYILYIYIYIYIFFKAVIVLMCNHFPRLLRTHFFYLFCKYFAAISVASSVQVSLQFYFQIFYSTAPNKIVIRLTKVPWGYKTISNKKYIQRNNSSKYTPVV